MKTKVLSLVYFLTGILFIFLPEGSPFITGFILKALIIPVLMALLFASFGRDLFMNHRLMLAGLFFSWAGDVLLELPYKSEYFFICGLAGFLVAHLMYLTVFIRTPGKNLKIKVQPGILVLLIIIGSALVYYLYDDLKGMRFPVILYALVILSMLWGAIGRKGKVNNTSYLLVLSGAILFVVSDSLLAINKFSFHFEAAGYAVMSTYIIAQFLIVIGYKKQFEHK
jgi:uncharacterized membrane protein YhhN